jgi:CheY-like chemotaxis protein
MSKAIIQVDDVYLVNCFNCNYIFDALEAAWCDCLSAEPTLVCNVCHSCFCKAPLAYKRKFWSEAPNTFWQRQHQHKGEEFVSVVEPTAQELPRPLVLILDDDSLITRIAVKVIKNLGYGVIVANDGEAGYKLAQQHLPDLILSDALMPKLDGRELCRRIKSEPTMANIKVIIMTSLYRNVKYMIEAHKNFQVDDYLHKPLDFDQLKQVLQKHLQ